jgi:hypothetical protein
VTLAAGLPCGDAFDCGNAGLDLGQPFPSAHDGGDELDPGVEAPAASPRRCASLSCRRRVTAGWSDTIRWPPPRTLTAIIDGRGPHDATVTALTQAVPYLWNRSPAGQAQKQTAGGGCLMVGLVLHNRLLASLSHSLSWRHRNSRNKPKSQVQHRYVPVRMGGHRGNRHPARWCEEIRPRP